MSNNTLLDPAGKLRTALAGKSVLFLDDEQVTVREQMLPLIRAGITCHWEETLAGALKQIDDPASRPGLVVIDLNLPPQTAPQLKSYEQKLQLQPTSFNRGRCLGLYLWEQRTDLMLPYCYVSALSLLLGERFDESIPEIATIDKVTFLPSQVVERLSNVMEQWQSVFFVGSAMP